MRYTTRGITMVGKDGIKRGINLTRMEDDSICLRWETWWAGEDKEPMRNGIRLGMEGLNATLELLSEFQCSPYDFPKPEPGEPEPKPLADSDLD